jgi:hypothetical protein
MSEESVEPVVKKPRKPRTKKVAETAPVENVEISEVMPDVDKVIRAVEAQRRVPTSNLKQNEDNVLGSRAANTFNKLIVEEPKPDMSNKVALWSDKNMRWSDVGAVQKGYNIVNKEAADKWLTRNGVREATPEEVATYYGK